MEERRQRLEKLTKKLRFKQSIANVAGNVRILRIQAKMIRRYWSILAFTMTSLTELQDELKGEARAMQVDQEIDEDQKQHLERYVAKFFTTDNETHTHVVGANYCEIRPSSMQFTAQRGLTGYPQCIARIEGTLTKEESILETLQSSKRLHDEFVEKHQQRYMEEKSLASDYAWKFEYYHCERLLPRNIVDFVNGTV